jgi:D-glycero-alpha-D-manno-heptose-7-phosphate kinase
MTPFRISFAGGGTDLKAFYQSAPGCVVSTTINKHMYIFVHPSFDEKTQVKYSRTELVDDIAEIKHPIVRETLKIFGLKGIDISSIADIPAGTGLGSSSAFTVGLFHALYRYTGQFPSKEQLARDACHMEIEILHEPIGRQDQYAASYGGLNLISFHEGDGVVVEPIEMPKALFRELEDNLLMFYTGGVRDAGQILSEQSKNSANQKERANLMRMSELARQLRDSLVNGGIDDLGLVLDEGWQLKKQLSNKISGSGIDEMYATAKKHGALGGKLLGAGGAGFFLCYCKKERQDELRRALANYRELEFGLDRVGTRIILNSD